MKLLERFASKCDPLPLWEPYKWLKEIQTDSWDISIRLRLFSLICHMIVFSIHWSIVWSIKCQEIVWKRPLRLPTCQSDVNVLFCHTKGPKNTGLKCTMTSSKHTTAYLSVLFCGVTVIFRCQNKRKISNFNQIHSHLALEKRLSEEDLVLK